MKRKSVGNTQCPIARSLERVGDWWNILILREAFYGVTRFDDFQTNLGIATNTLTRRLNDLVEGDLLRRELYSEKPPRHEYVLTDVGRSFRPVLLTLVAWGNENFAPEGRSVELADPATGLPVEPVLIDKTTGRPLSEGVKITAGPAAEAAVRRRFERRPMI
jgi:DNA-binding HxlR family transcriptional regulator